MSYANPSHKLEVKREQAWVERPIVKHREAMGAA